MDPSNRRPQLPALSYLDVDKVKREEDAYQSRNIGTTAQSLSASTAASPSYNHPPGPPPPYSHAHTGPPPANAWSSIPAAAHTPQPPHRAGDSEKEVAKQPARQSLPSISEALGVDSQTAFAPAIAPPPPPPPPPPSLTQAHLPPAQSTAPPSPSTTRRGPPTDPPGTLDSFLGNKSYPPISSCRADSITQPSYPSVLETARTPAAYPAVSESKPALHLHTSQTPSRQSHATSFSRPSEPSPPYEQPPPHPSGAMGPPSSFAYGYTPYPPRYANPTPPSSVSSGPIYHSSSTYGAAQSNLTWKPEAGHRFEDRQPKSGTYGDHVKRHLDFYDLEAALNDIASTSGILTDFSRRYGDRMHQTQRSGASLSTLPGIVEVDDMISKSRVQLDSLSKIRDVILAQQALYEQQVADQHHKTFSESAQAAPDHHLSEAEDKQPGGFAGMDTKKRRGRAAPPGRCHSCNRAETPEWRRGPDGARTLCNACGLHYAKLTRKKNGANNNNNTTVGSSNLRPKETGQ